MVEPLLVGTFHSSRISVALMAVAFNTGASGGRGGVSTTV